MLWLLKEIIRPIYFWITNDVYRCFTRLLSCAGKTGTFTLYGKKVIYLEGASAAWQVREIFFDGSYDIESKNDHPVILDCGANIGLSALSFLTHYPKANLTVIEAHPEVSVILEKNLQNWQVPGQNKPRRIQAAVWTHANGVEFALNQADGSSIHGAGKKVKVPSIRLKSLLSEYENIDFLKMDIEGAEVEVLQDCAEELHRVRQLFVEYHSPNENEQKLPELLQLLKAKGFRIYSETTCGRKRPFLNRRGSGDFDLQLNIFGTR